MQANGCPMSGRACAYTTAAGNLEALKLLREFQCPWNGGMCIAAAKNSHLDSLKWARTNGSPWDACTSTSAAISTILKCSNGPGNGCPWEKETYREADIQKYPKQLFNSTILAR